MLLLRCLFLLPIISLALLRSAAAAAPIAELTLGGDSAPYEYRLVRALGDDSEIWEKKAGAAPAFDPEAAAIRRGDWLQAYAEVGTALRSPGQVLDARGYVRAGWILARFGVAHYAADRVSQGLHDPTARGEALLARAWAAWHCGQFTLADEQAALAAQGDHPAPAWALEDWRQYRTAHTKAAAAVQPIDGTGASTVLTAAYLERADRLRAAGAINAADFCYEKILDQWRALGPNAPAATRALAARAAIGQREDMLALWGGRLPGPDFGQVSVVILERARAAAFVSMAPTDWAQLFALVAGVQANPGSIDLAELDLHGDFALAEKQAGLGPEWRERLKPLLADPRLRYASRLTQALARCEAHPGFDVTPDIADAAKFAELVALLDAEQKVLAGLHALVPSGAPTAPAQTKFDQADALIRLRQALQQGDAAAARAQFTRYEALDALFPTDSDAFEARVAGLERRHFFAALDDLADLSPEELDAAEVTHLSELADRATQRLLRVHGGDIENPASLTPDEREEAIRVLYVPVLAAVHAQRVLPAEAALGRFENWSRHELVRDSALLRVARIEVADMPMEKNEFVGEEKALGDALIADEAERTFVPKLRDAITRDPSRLTPRLLLALTHWRLAEDEAAAEAVTEIRRLAPHVTALHAQLDQMAANNDTVRVCAQFIQRLQQAPANERPAVITAARATANRFLQRIRRVWHEGQPVELENFTGSPAFREYAQAYALHAHASVAAGDLRNALGLLSALRRAGANEACAPLLPVVEHAPFRHDLPTPELVAAWRTLLSGRVLSPAELQQLYAQFQPYIGKSLSVDLAYCLFIALSSDSAKARARLEALQATGRYNRAFARQLDALDDFIAARTDKGTVLLFGNEQATHDQWSNAKQALSNFVDANRAALKESYDNNEETPLTRHVVLLEREVNELARTANTEADKNQAALHNAARARQLKVSEAMATLSKLTL